MKRVRFVAAGGAVLLGACSAHGSVLPSLVGARDGSRAAEFMPPQALPHPAILGECRRFDGAIVPVGWSRCDGSLLDIKNNPSLFRILGRSAGGDGRTTFGLPKAGEFPFVISTGGIAVSSPKELAAIFAQRARQRLTTTARPSAAISTPPRAASP